MRYHVLACDYDGTLAHNGQVDQPTLASLERLLASGRKLVLVTGRELDEILEIFPEVRMFVRVVAENGAVLYRPETKEQTLLADAPPENFIKLIRERGVAPMSVGRSIVATWRPHENTVLDCIRELGLELQVIFNKDAVMVLPSGINKAHGLAAALVELGLSAHEAVGIGDAENDHAFLDSCECSAAVANALPAVKQRADIVTRGDHGAGVQELIERMLADDLARLDGRLRRHHLRLGHRSGGEPVDLPPYGGGVLIAGPSGSGKSTAATSFLERLADRQYQFCIIDPEGDYENLPGALTLGSGHGVPNTDEVFQLLAEARTNIVVNLIGMPLTDRPPFFASLLPRLAEMRMRTARPHWIVVDEAHHLLPASWNPGSQSLGRDLLNTLFITVHPNQVHRSALQSVETVIAVGQGPDETIAQFCAALEESPPALPPGVLDAGEVVLWSRSERWVDRVKVVPCRTERRRHTRKYAEGELPPERSFYFRGPEGKLNLRAQNLIIFLQLSDGVDDETWLFHLRQGDYSRWFRERIKDEDLARDAAQLEQSRLDSAAAGRAQLRALIEQYYTHPTKPPLPMPGTDATPQHSA